MGPRLPAALTLLVASLGAWGCGPSEPDVERPRNVLLFVVDTLRADRLGCYGYERDTSPGIDAFAAQGTLFERNHSQACWTVPSMISMMSGGYVASEELALPGSPTLAEVVSAGGVRTAAFVGNRTLTNDRGFQRGFDHFQAPRAEGMNGMAHSIVENFERWYDASEAGRDGGAGWFAWLHPIDPHDPYEPSDRFRRFEGQELPREADLRERWRSAEPLVEKYARGKDAWGFEQAALSMREQSNLYDGEVVQVDDAFARLIGFLRRKGALEDTLILFASDHGEKLWEHMRYPQGVRSRLQGQKGTPEGVKEFFAWGHRAWFHEELWNTPLILMGPGVPAGVRANGLSANLDIFPTILDAFDLPALPGLAGQSLLDGAAADRERVFAYGFDTKAMLASDGTKVIEHPPATYLLDPDAAPVGELFDLVADPDELENKCEVHSDECATLRDALEQWAALHQGEGGGELSEADREALRDLGYLGDE